MSETKRQVVEEQVENWNEHWKESVEEVCERTGLSLTEFLLWRILTRFHIADRERAQITQEFFDKQERLTDHFLREVEEGDEWKDSG